MGLTIGPLRVDPPVVLAPMAGVTNIAFRRLCRSYGAGLYISEMVTASALIQHNPRTMSMVRFADDEVRSVQLYGVDPVTMDRAVRQLVTEIGVDHIDLNFGCPATKVTRKGGGAALPAHPRLLGRILRLVVAAAGRVPVTVKMRIGLDDNHRTALRSALIAQDAGVAAVTLHARTAEQLYAGAADWAAIGELKMALSIPTLGNGDIWTAQDAVRMMDRTGCDGVVVGRGCLGRPWLFGDLSSTLAGRPVESSPSLGVVADTMRAHAELLCAAMGEYRGIRELRKHVAWYLTGFPVGGSLRRAMASATSTTELEGLLGRLDRTVPFPESARRVRRGHTGGPRPVALPAGWLAAVDDDSVPVGAELAVSGG